jgi:ER membrane protein complex subunit 7
MALIVCLAVGSVHAVVVAAAPAEETVTYYGQLHLPEAYLRHPDSQNPLNKIQQGSVLLADGHSTIMVPTARDGSFIVYKLPYGTYLMQVDYHDFEFPTLRVDVMYRETGDGKHEPLIRTSTNDFPVKQVEGTGLEEESPALIPVSGMHQYYMPRQEMRLSDIVKNPMILMLLISGGLMGLMKLFPEEDVKESQRMSREWQKKLAAKVAAAAEKPGAAKK